MDRDLLGHLPVILTVARRRGFAAAATELGMSASAVSHAVRAVEMRLREPIFARTTRSVSLTEAGELFIAAIEPAFVDIDRALETLGDHRGEVTGLLRINAPRIALPMILTSLVTKLTAEHPLLTVEVQANDALINIVESRFDAGIRLGPMIDQDMIAFRLTPPFNSIIVASPSYLKSMGTPRKLDDLRNHNCIGYRHITNGGIYDWEVREGSHETKIKTSGTVVVSDPTHARELALAGIGIAYLFDPLVRQDIREDRLKWLLPKSAIEEDGLFLYYPKGASDSPKLRVFVEAARQLRKVK
jgi:DNA-binding transcriptional LysR family regulator